MRDHESSLNIDRELHDALTAAFSAQAMGAPDARPFLKEVQHLRAQRLVRCGAVVLLVLMLVAGAVVTVGLVRDNGIQPATPKSEAEEPAHTERKPASLGTLLRDRSLGPIPATPPPAVTPWKWLENRADDEDTPIPSL